MSNGDQTPMTQIQTRAREIGPGVFIPFPDSDQAVQEDAREQLQQNVSQSGDEPDKSCEAALSEGLDAETLGSYNGVRQWVMCQAWEYHRQQNIPFADAVNRAWGDVRDARGD